MSLTRLDGKRALVVGGSRGIGAAVVRALAARGADVSFTFAQSGDAAAALAEEIGGRAIRADSADPAAAAAVARDLAPLAVLVVSAGVTVAGDPLATIAGEIDRMFDINLRTPYHIVVEAARTMPEGGRIILIGSTMADAIPFPGLAAYSASKAALRGMARGFARDFGSRSITVNVVEPGPVNTDANPADGPMAAEIISRMALARYIDPDEIGEVVAFLAGAGGRSITGTALKVDGGFGL